MKTKEGGTRRLGITRLSYLVTRTTQGGDIVGMLGGGFSCGSSDNRADLLSK